MTVESLACVADVWKGREREKRETSKTPFSFPFKRLPRRLSYPLLIYTSDSEALARYYVTSYWQAEWVKKLRWKTIELPPPWTNRINYARPQETAKRTKQTSNTIITVAYHSRWRSWKRSSMAKIAWDFSSLLSIKQGEKRRIGFPMTLTSGAVLNQTWPNKQTSHE